MGLLNLVGFRYVWMSILMLTVSVQVLAGGAKTDSLRAELASVMSDTAKIKVMFKLGNQFIDGPSDSLLHYYTLALRIIDDNLRGFPEDTNPENSLTFKTFKSLKMRALIEFGIEYFFRSEYDGALGYYFRAAEIALELGDEVNLSECYGEIGIVYKNQGKFDLALEYQEKALEVAITTNDEDWIAICNTNIGNIYKEKGYLTIAQDYYLKALKTFEKLNQDRRVAACCTSIGDMYFEQKDFEKALEYFQNAFDLSCKTGDRVRESNILLAIGNIHAERGDHTLAREYYNKSVALYDTLGYQHNLDDCYKSIGISFLKEGEPDKALAYFNQALGLSGQEQDNINIAEILGGISQAYLLKNNQARALEYAQRSLETASLTGAPRMKMYAYKNLYEVWGRRGDPAKALEYFRLYSGMKDSLFIAGQFRAITEMEIKYQTEKKEQDIALLTEHNKVQELMIGSRTRFIVAIAIVFLLSLLIGYALLVNTRLKARHRASELENRLLRSQMNPHFIFNSLIAIQSYIYKKNPVSAGDYLSKFADLVRMTLENSRVEFVPLEKELNMLNIYLQLQMLRFGDTFSFDIEKDKNIEADMIKIPPMLTQPFIENAVEHGFRLKEGLGNIKVRCHKKAGDIEFIIEDNGVGREFAAQHKKAKHNQSMATMITRERLEVMGKKFKRKFTLEVIDLKGADGNAKGTRVVITMPFVESI